MGGIPKKIVKIKEKYKKGKLLKKSRQRFLEKMNCKITVND